MSDFGRLDLDEHAAFWARDDEREGRASGRVEFKIGKQPFAFRCREARYVRAAPPNSRDGTHWFYEVEGSNALFVSPSSASKPREAVEIFERRFAFRPFRVSQAPRYGAAVYPDGSAHWFYRSRDKAGNLAFLSQSPFDCAVEITPIQLLQWPQHEFVAHFERQWQSPDSEMRRAFEFDQLSIAERDNYVLGDSQQLRALTRLVGQLMWDDLSREERLWLDFLLPTYFNEFEAQTNKRLKDLNQRYKSWRSAVLGALKPNFIGREDNPKFIQEWLWSGRVKSLLAVEISAPSHHEQLEAHLQLREWAKLHCSQAQQRELFDTTQ